MAIKVDQNFKKKIDEEQRQQEALAAAGRITSSTPVELPPSLRSATTQNTPSQFGGLIGGIQNAKPRPVGTPLTTQEIMNLPKGTGTPSTDKKPEGFVGSSNDEGNAFIREREKLAAQIQEKSGVSNKQATAQANQQLEQAGTSFKQVGVGEAQAFANSLQGQQQQASVDLSGDNPALAAALNLPSIGAGAVSGAGVGALVGGPVGAVAGGIIGGLSAFLAKLSLDKRQATKEAYKVFTRTTGESYSEVLRAANSGFPPGDVMTRYEGVVANVRASQSALKRETKTTLGKQLSGAQDELLAVELWLDNEEFYRAQVIQAIQNPNKGAFIPTPQNEEANTA